MEQVTRCSWICTIICIALNTNARKPWITKVDNSQNQKVSDPRYKVYNLKALTQLLVVQLTFYFLYKDTTKRGQLPPYICTIKGFSDMHIYPITTHPYQKKNSFMTCVVTPNAQAQNCQAKAHPGLSPLPHLPYTRVFEPSLVPISVDSPPARARWAYPRNRIREGIDGISHKAISQS